MASERSPRRGRAADLARTALLEFALSLGYLALLGLALAAAAYYSLMDHGTLWAAIGAAIALAESLAAGLALGVYRAIAAASAKGLESLRLGRTLVRLAFDRVPQGVAAGVERVPLAKAEELLTAAARGATGDTGRGWLQGKVQTRLTEAVRKYTLARFRKEGENGIDLPKVQAELEETIDASLAAKVRSASGLWRMAVLLGLPLLVAAQTWAVLLILRAKG